MVMTLKSREMKKKYFNDVEEMKESLKTQFNKVIARDFFYDTRGCLHSNVSKYI
jgi:hypothetical protein